MNGHRNLIGSGTTVGISHRHRVDERSHARVEPTRSRDHRIFIRRSISQRSTPRVRADRSTAFRGCRFKIDRGIVANNVGCRRCDRRILPDFNRHAGCCCTAIAVGHRHIVLVDPHTRPFCIRRQDRRILRRTCKPIRPTPVVTRDRRAAGHAGGIEYNRFVITNSRIGTGRHTWQRPYLDSHLVGAGTAVVISHGDRIHMVAHTRPGRIAGRDHRILCIAGKAIWSTPRIARDRTAAGRTTRIERNLIIVTDCRGRTGRHIRIVPNLDINRRRTGTTVRIRDRHTVSVDSRTRPRATARGDHRILDVRRESSRT